MKGGEIITEFLINEGIPYVDANVRPPSTGTWQLPPTPYKEPVFGKRAVV